MRFLIKQRVFAWGDTYDIFDEYERPVFFVKAEVFTLGHKIHVYDMAGNEVGFIQQKLLSFMPKFEIYVMGNYCGIIQKEFAFVPKYRIEYNSWHCVGDFVGWNYEVLAPDRSVARISKQLFRWGDTYVIDILNPADELPALMLCIAIDAANCDKN